LYLATSLTSDFAYCDRFYRSVICLSVTFLHCAQTAEDIAMIFTQAYDSPMSLPDHVKI